MLCGGGGSICCKLSNKSFHIQSFLSHSHSLPISVSPSPRLGVLIKRIMFWYNKSLTTERQRGRHIYLHASSTNILSQLPLSLASALRIYFQLHFANGEENASHNSAPTIGPDMTHTHRYTLYSILYMPH